MPWLVFTFHLCLLFVIVHLFNNAAYSAPNVTRFSRYLSTHPCPTTILISLISSQSFFFIILHSLRYASFCPCIRCTNPMLRAFSPTLSPSPFSVSLISPLPFFFIFLHSLRSPCLLSSPLCFFAPFESEPKPRARRGVGKPFNPANLTFWRGVDFGSPLFAVLLYALELESVTPCR